MTRKIIYICLVLAVLLPVAGISAAKAPVPGRTGSWVNDYAGIIDKETKDYLEGRISSIKQKTPQPVEIIVATFRSIEGWSIEDFALAYGEKWREIKGGSRDNGVIVLVALDEGSVFIGAGRNLKGILTDAIVNDIIQRVIIPDFKNGNFSKGIKAAVDILIDTLEKAEIPSGSMMLVLRNAILALICLAALFAIFRFLSMMNKKIIGNKKEEKNETL